MSFPVEDEIVELNGYALPEGYTRENPQISVENVTLQGPALEIGRVAAVKAHVELGKDFKKTQTLPAELIFVGTSENANLTNISVKNEEPVFVTVPVSYTATLKPVVNFTTMPKDLRSDGIEYVISPAQVKMSVITGEGEQPVADEITIGNIDFSELNNDRNYFRLPVDSKELAFTDGTKQFDVTIDMSSMHKRWLEVNVSTKNVKLPAGAELLSKTVQSVQVVGPAASVDAIDSSEAYAVPVLDNVKLEKGVNTVPVKIVLRTLTDSWVRGEYTVEIRVGN